MRYTDRVPCNLCQIRTMSSQTRDSLALYAIVTVFVLVTLYADGGLGRLFQAVMERI